MGSNNTRILQKDILSLVTSTEAGSSAAIDLNGAAKFSCQAIYDVQTPSNAVVNSASAVFLSSDPTHPSELFKVSHGFPTGLKVQIATAGTLPTPFVAVTDYFVIKVSADYFALATSLANALAGTRIAITNVGSGNQTVAPTALAGASLTFQKSNDATNWTDIAAATSITADGIAWVENGEVTYRYFRAVKALTSGVVDIKAITLIIGDDI